MFIQPVDNSLYLLTSDSSHDIREGTTTQGSCGAGQGEQRVGGRAPGCGKPGSVLDLGALCWESGRNIQVRAQVPPRYQDSLQRWKR